MVESEVRLEVLFKIRASTLVFYVQFIFASKSFILLIFYNKLYILVVLVPVL